MELVCVHVCAHWCTCANVWYVYVSTCIMKLQCIPPPPPCRVCAILVVEGASAYNDSVTAALRDVARRGMDVAERGHIHFGYVDKSIQSAFVESFRQFQHEVRQCSNGELGRPVCVCTWTSGA